MALFAFALLQAQTRSLVETHPVSTSLLGFVEGGVCPGNESRRIVLAQQDSDAERYGDSDRDIRLAPVAYDDCLCPQTQRRGHPHSVFDAACRATTPRTPLLCSALRTAQK